MTHAGTGERRRERRGAPRPRGALVAIPALLVLLGLLAAPARAERIETIDGSLDEPIRAIERENEILLLRTTQRTLPCAEVREIRFPAAAADPKPGPVRLFLLGGDELTGEIAEGDERRVALESQSLGRIEVPLEALIGVAWSSDEAELSRFRREILGKQAKEDSVVTRAWGSTDGLIERIDPRGVTIDSRAIGRVTLGPEKALGARIAALGKPPQRPEGLVARVETADGSSIAAAPIRLQDGVLRLDFPLRSPLDVRVSEVRTLAFAGGRFVYISDLEPAEVEERTAVISKIFPYVRRDRSVVNGPLRLDGETYRKGLGVHAYSKVVYALDGRYARFRARIGLDDSARERRGAEGAVRFQVLVDGKPALGPEGILLTTRDASRPIDVDVRGAKSLALIADFGESKDILARGDWADAFLVEN